MSLAVPLRPSFVLGGLLLTLLCTLPLPAPAQTPPEPDGTTLRGQVLADDTGEALLGATVALRRAADSTLVTGTITDAEGRFLVERVPSGRYDLRISYVGFEAVERPDLNWATGAPPIELGVVRLRLATAAADGVEVTARRELMEVQIDRTVFNVRDQITAVGGSASDVLQDLPSIEVDLDGTVSYRGNENVAVHVNGRPSSLSGEALASFLKSLSADAVERVEVIPNPSARYEPDGMAGIINIVLAKDQTAGWSGGLTAGVGTNDTYNGSVNLGYQQNDWTLFSTYGYRTDRRDGSGTRFRENLLQSPSVFLNQRSLDERNRASHAWTTQAEYQLGDETTLGLQTVLSQRGGTEEGQTTNFEEVGGTLTDEFARLEDGTREDLGLDARLSLDHTFGNEDHVLSGEVRYEQEWEDEGGRYAEFGLLDGVVTGDPLRRDDEQIDEREREGTLRLDYTRPIGVLSLETGYQGSLRSQETDQRFDRTDERLQTTISAFGFDEQIHAGYGILSRDWGPVGLKAGLRAEQALTTFTLDTTAEAFDNDYFSFFPSAFLTYEFTEGQQMRLSYSKRVSRPRLWQLNPVSDNDDPTFRRVGNPFLEPEYVHAVEASYVRHWDALTLTASPYLRRTVNEVQWQETFSPDGITTLTFANAAASNSYGAELIGALSLGSRLRGNVSVNGYRVVTDASNLDTDLSNDSFAYSGRLNLTLQPRDGLSTMGFHVTRRDNSFYQVTDRDWGARQLSVSLTYNFGRSGPDSRSRTRADDGQDFGGGEEGMQ